MYNLPFRLDIHITEANNEHLVCTVEYGARSADQGNRLFENAFITAIRRNYSKFLLNVRV